MKRRKPGRPIARNHRRMVHVNLASQAHAKLVQIAGRKPTAQRDAIERLILGVSLLARDWPQLYDTR